MVTDENYYLQQRYDGTLHAMQTLIERLLIDDETVRKVSQDAGLHDTQRIQLKFLRGLLGAEQSKIYAELYERRSRPLNLE